MSLTVIAVIVAAVGILLWNTFKILKEYERGVVFFLGKFYKVKGPGLILLFPIIQVMTKVDLRVIVMDVPTQDVISRDNVSVKVNAVIYFRIVDPEKAVIRVANVFEATSQLSQTTLRSVLGQHELDDMLAERDKLNADIQALLDQRTDNWGIKVANVEIKHVDLDESMIRAIAQQAEAERSRRAKVINAEGEKQAALMIAEAARTLAAFSGRDYAVPDDVVQIALPALRHRCILTAEAEVEGHSADSMLTELIRSVEVPRL